MPTQPQDAVQHAVEVIDYDAYARRSDGTMIAQTSAPEIIADLLDLLDPPSGAKVLEVGTGSGYSTALLATLIGPSGHVTTIDIDPSLTSRAEKLLSQAGFTNVTVHTGDGARGVPEQAPYTHVIVWATAREIPCSWVEQAAPEGVIVTPVQLAPIPRSTAALRARITAAHTLAGERLVPAGFIELHPEVITEFRRPARDIDAIRTRNGEITWVSAEWLRGPGHGASDHRYGEALLDLLERVEQQPSPLAPDEDPEEFWAFLLSSKNLALTTGGINTGSGWVGLSAPGRFALVHLYADAYVTGGSPDAEAEFAHAIEHWRSLGRPGHQQLRPTVSQASEGWQIRATLLDEGASGG